MPEQTTSGSMCAFYILVLVVFFIAGCSMPVSPPPPATWTLGDFVWHDMNADGIQGDGENGLPGVLVHLFDSSDHLVGSTTTGGNGEYSFDSLPSGNYYLEFNPLMGYVFSPQDQGGDDSLDSDANPANGKTGLVSLISGENNISVDAGLLPSIGELPTSESATSTATVTVTVTVTSTASPTPTSTITPTPEETALTPLPGTWLYQSRVGSSTCAGSAVVQMPSGEVELTVSPDGNTFFIAFPNITLDFSRFTPFGPAHFAGIYDSFIDTHGGNPATINVELIWNWDLISATEMEGILTAKTSEPCVIVHSLYMEKK